MRLVERQISFKIHEYLFNKIDNNEQMTNDNYRDESGNIEVRDARIPN